MSSFFWKSFRFCFSKFMCFPTITTSSSLSPSNQDDDYINPIPSRLIIKNFNSLYDLSSSSTTITTTTTTNDDLFFTSSCETDSPLPDFTTIFASQRFFVTSPGNSNSIIDNSLESQASSSFSNGVAINKYSPDPYTDFKRSMQEMIDAEESASTTRVDSHYLHQLLFCYLSLNPKLTHKFIISAFADIVITHLSSSSESKIRRRRHRRIVSS